MTAVISLREQKKTDARQRLITAAIRLFSKNTIERTTVDQIALAAKVGKGTVYNHFQSKEEIVVAFLITIEQKVHDHVPEFASRQGGLIEILIAFLDFQLKLKQPHHQFVRAFFAQLFSAGSSSSPWVRQLQDTIDPPLELLFKTLQSRKLIRSDLEIATLIQLFKMLHVGLMTVWVMEGPPWTGTHYLLTEQIRVFCQGIQRRSK